MLFALCGSGFAPPPSFLLPYLRHVSRHGIIRAYLRLPSILQPRVVHRAGERFGGDVFQLLLPLLLLLLLHFAAPPRELLLGLLDLVLVEKIVIIENTAVAALEVVAEAAELREAGSPNIYHQ